MKAAIIAWIVFGLWIWAASQGDYQAGQGPVTMLLLLGCLAITACEWSER